MKLGLRSVETMDGDSFAWPMAVTSIWGRAVLRAMGAQSGPCHATPLSRIPCLSFKPKLPPLTGDEIRVPRKEFQRFCEAISPGGHHPCGLAGTKICNRARQTIFTRPRLAPLAKGGGSARRRGCGLECCDSSQR